MSGVMRGLSMFIGDIRNCQNKSSEEKLVTSELAKIRKKFTNRGLSGYDRKKYVWKLIYIYMLGYEVDFGFQEAVNLINNIKFSEKSTGYIATGIMFNENTDSDLLDIALNSIRSDVRNMTEVYSSLAISTVANIGAQIFAKNLNQVISDIAFGRDDTRPSIYVIKKANACLLSLYRRHPKYFNTSTWPDGIAKNLKEKNYGLLLTSVTLLKGIIEIEGPHRYASLAGALITRLMNMHQHAHDYYYYMTPCPWLQIRILQVLQRIPPQMLETVVLDEIHSAVRKIFKSTEVTNNKNKNNADHSILFEAIAVVLKYGEMAQKKLRQTVMELLLKFIQVREANIRYLALDLLAKLPEQMLVQYKVGDHLNTILVSLKDHDLSIRRRALDLMFVICDQKLAVTIVNEFLNYLRDGDFSLQEEIVLKIAILAEKFSTELNWYIDVVVAMIESASTSISDDIWHRIAQIVTGFGQTEPNVELQRYAALKLYTALNKAHVPDVLLKLGAFVLAEFGHLIIDIPGKSFMAQFELLRRHFTGAKSETRAIMMSSFIKYARYDPSLKDEAAQFFQQYTSFWDPDIQQRAVEYLRLCNDDELATDLLNTAIDPMPTFADSIRANNPVLRRMYQLKVDKGLSAGAADVGDKKRGETVAKYETYLSTVLSGPAKVATHEVEPSAAPPVSAPAPAPQPSATSLIDMGGPTPSGPAVGYQDPGMFETVTVTTDVSHHPFFQKYGASFAAKATVNPTFAVKLNTAIMQNGSEWKGLLPVNVKEGVLYQDSTLQVSAKLIFMKYFGRITLDFVSKGGQFNEIKPTLHPVNGLYAQISAIKYPPAGQPGNPQALIQTMLDGPVAEATVLELHYSTTGYGPGHALIHLPLLMHKFVEPVEMPSTKYQQLWQDITVNRPDTFQKLDALLKNPAPPSVPLIEVLKKMAGLLSQCMNLKVYPPENPQAPTKIQAVGQVLFKAEDQVAFPTGPQDLGKPIGAPLMIEIQFYPDIGVNEFRFSIRSSNLREVALPILSIFKLYVNPNE